MDVDLVLLAMGFTGPVKNGLLDSLGVNYDARGNVVERVIGGHGFAVVSRWNLVQKMVDSC